MICDYCKSERLYLKDAEGKTGLFCKSCGRWLKWIEPSERAGIELTLEKLKQEVRLEGRDVLRFYDKYKGYKSKSKALRDEVSYYDASKAGSEMEKKTMYAKALKLKELSAKIEAYEEVIMTLGLKEPI